MINALKTRVKIVFNTIGFTLMLALTALTLSHSSVFAAMTVIIDEFPVTTPASQPRNMASGPDGNIWFTENLGNNIGVMTTDGVMVAEYPIPTPNSGPAGIALGPDGNMWFTEGFNKDTNTGGNNIGRITPAGVITEFPALPDPDSRPYGITFGQDGNLWFTNLSSSKIGRMTLAGVLTEFPTPTTGALIDIQPDAGDCLWFTNQTANKIGVINLDGEITEFDVPNPTGFPGWIALGPDGNMWFSEIGGDALARVMSSETEAPTTPTPVPAITSGDTPKVPNTGLMGVRDGNKLITLAIPLLVSVVVYLAKKYKTGNR